jgi:PleD family two-component response regulator
MRNETLMNRGADTSLSVLVVEDVAETGDGIEKLLNADGYRVAVARDERDAIERAQLKHPDLWTSSPAFCGELRSFPERRTRHIRRSGAPGG